MTLRDLRREMAAVERGPILTPLGLRFAAEITKDPKLLQACRNAARPSLHPIPSPPLLAARGSAEGREAVTKLNQTSRLPHPAA